MKLQEQDGAVVKPTKKQYVANRKAIAKKRKQYAAFQKALAKHEAALAQGEDPDETARHAWGGSNRNEDGEDTEDGAEQTA